MTTLLIIGYYFFQAALDTADKFLLSARKIKALPYTFFTVVMGLVLLLIWPLVYEHLSYNGIILDIASGVVFSLALYVFFKALSEGEVSRVVPFVFGLVPLTDLLLALATGRNLLNVREGAAMFLLLPGAILISYKKNKFVGRHVGLKVLSAFLWSVYYALWAYAAQSGSILNHLMWNRIGAAGILIALLMLPAARKAILNFKQTKQKKQTSVLFIIKQVIGGATFIYLSFLLVIAKVSIVNGLQGFRYVFLLLAALFLHHFHNNSLDEEMDKRSLWQKAFAIVLIFAGTAILFI